MSVSWVHPSNVGYGIVAWRGRIKKGFVLGVWNMIP